MKFAGEDPFKNDRVKAQQLQQQEWLSQQLAMLREKEERERAEEACVQWRLFLLSPHPSFHSEHAAITREITEIKKDLEVEQFYNRTKRNVESKEFNQQLVRPRRYTSAS